MVGEDDFAGFAFEEGLADLLFEFLDGAGQGGLRKMEFEGCLGEVFGAGEDDELLEGMEFEVGLHGWILAMRRTHCNYSNDALDAWLRFGRIGFEDGAVALSDNHPPTQQNTPWKTSANAP